MLGESTVKENMSSDNQAQTSKA